MAGRISSGQSFRSTTTRDPRPYRRPGRADYRGRRQRHRARRCRSCDGGAGHVVRAAVRTPLNIWRRDGRGSATRLAQILVPPAAASAAGPAVSCSTTATVPSLSASGPPAAHHAVLRISAYRRHAHPRHQLHGALAAEPSTFCRHSPAAGRVGLCMLTDGSQVHPTPSWRQLRSRRPRVARRPRRLDQGTTAWRARGRTYISSESAYRSSRLLYFVGH